MSFNSSSQPAIGGSIKRLIEQIQILNKQNFEVYLACDTKEEGERLNELIEEELTAPQIYSEQLTASNEQQQLTTINR